MTDLPNSYFLM